MAMSISVFTCNFSLLFWILCLQDVKIEKQESSATWSVLRDNFLTGSNLKDWDKCGEIKLEDDIDEVELH